MNDVSNNNLIKRLGHNHIQLPYWLDDYIFRETKAKHEPCCKDMIVLNWDYKQIVSYLGTYFPRSFSESYCIFTKYLDLYKIQSKDTSKLNVFDFGCGTGGEILGLLCALSEKEYRGTVNIKAFDGNHDALRILENIVDIFKEVFDMDIACNVIPVQIDDIYDMSLISDCIRQDNDIILIFKSICEMATVRQFENKNPYKHILQIMQSKLSSNGIICLADVTSFNEEQKEWLPMLIDIACKETNSKVIMRNEGFNETFYVTHSCKRNDKSKLSWRIIKKNNL